MAEEFFDVVFIGAGPGGYVGAIRAAQLGLKTALIEKDSLGGVCLNVGCIPSKAMITASHFLHRAKVDAPQMGFEIPGPIGVNMEKLLAWKNSVTRQMSQGVGQLLKANGVSVIQGEASLKGLHEIAVKKDKDVQFIKAKNIVLAMGSRPFELPGFSFDEKQILSSTGALALNQLPESLVIIGGGYIGLEIGSYLALLGCKRVQVLEAQDSILKGVVDPEAAQVVFKNLKKIGVEVLLETKAQSAKKTGKGSVDLEVLVKGKAEKLSAEKVLVTIGRRPNSENMGLKELGVQVDEKGFVVVDKQMRTQVPHIFAIGDLAGQPMLAHKASYEGVMVAEILAGQNRAFDAKSVPAVVFTFPEIASAGLSEQEASTHFGELLVAKFPFQANGRAVSMMETAGFVKIFADKKLQIVRGVHIVGPEASNLISEAVLAIEMGASLTDLARTIHPHPTLGETMMEAAEAALGHAIHMIQRPLKKQ